MIGLAQFIPWWAWLILAAGAIGAVWRLLGWQGAVALGAGLIAAFGYGKGRADSAAAEQARQNQSRLDAIKDRKETDDETTGMDGTTLDRNYDRWLRDDHR